MTLDLKTSDLATRALEVIRLTLTVLVREKARIVSAVNPRLTPQLRSLECHGACWSGRNIFSDDLEMETPLFLVA